MDALLDLAVDPLVIHDEQVSAETLGWGIIYLTHKAESVILGL
jgi:hypothetical protein